jgi:hypothetical protein
VSLNDFENVEEPLYEFESATFTNGEPVLSKMGQLVHDSLETKEALDKSMADALDKAFELGYEVGLGEAREEIAREIDEEDSACAGWAADVVRRSKP